MRILLVILFLFLFPIGSIANNEITHRSFMYQQSQVHIIESPAQRISVGFTLKGHNSGVNCSYFNMNTRKTIAPGSFNRPFIIIKDKKVILSDNKNDLIDNKAVSGGSWLIRDGKLYSTSDHFTKGFKGMLVRRTFVGIDKNNNVYLVVMTKANFYKMQKLAQKLELKDALNLDGGTSTTLKYNGKMYVSGKRSVVNYLVAD